MLPPYAKPAPRKGSALEAVTTPIGRRRGVLRLDARRGRSQTALKTFSLSPGKAPRQHHTINRPYNAKLRGPG